MLRETSYKYGFDRGLRASLTNMQTVKLSIPVNEDGIFDVEYQRFIASQLEAVNQVKSEILERKNIISNVAVTVGVNNYASSFRRIALTDKSLFVLLTSGIGKNRTILNTINTQNSNDIPVYTAGLEPVAYIAGIEDKPPIYANRDSHVLSFATNGDGSAGRNFVLHDRPFYINTDRIAVQILDNRISSEFLLSQLYDMKIKYKFGHSFKANRHNLKVVVFDIPIGETGEFDVLAQREIAEVYSIIEQYRIETVDRLNALLTQRIEF